MLRETFPYLIFDEQAEEAIEFYADIFDARVIDVTYFHDIPDDPEFPVTEEAKDLVMNASIELPNGDVYMFSDNIPGMPFDIGRQLAVAITFDDVEGTRHVFSHLSEGGKIMIDLQETFWSPLYGTVTARYGNQWQVMTEEKNTWFKK